MGDLPPTFRHKMSLGLGGRWCCTCGFADFYGGTVLRHIQASRRWRYLGVEVHAGERYHLWENDLTHRRYAWLADKYRAYLTGKPYEYFDGALTT